MPQEDIYFIKSPLCRTSPTSVSSTHIVLYHGWQENWGCDDSVEPTFAVNLAAGQVRIPSSELVLTPELSEALTCVCSARSCPAQVAFAFDHPVRPDDGLDEHFAGIEMSSDALLSAYLRERGEFCEPLLLHRMVVPIMRRLAPYPSDAVELIVRDPGMIECDVVVSQEFVHREGLVRSSGFLAAGRVLEVLRPHLDDTYFIVKRLAI